MENGVLGKLIGFIAVILIILVAALFGLDYLKKQAEDISATAQVEQSIVIEQQAENYFL